MDALPYAMVVVRDSHIIHANPAFCSLMGYPREQVEGACIEQFSTHQAPLMTERHQRRMRGERVPELYETSLRTARGELRVELNVSVAGPDVLVLVRDLSDRLLQRQLLQRMATLGASLPGIHSEQEVLHRVFEGLAALGLSHGYLVPEGDRVRLAHAFIAEHTTPQETRFNGQHLVDAQGSWSPLLRHAWREEPPTRKASPGRRTSSWARAGKSRCGPSSGCWPPCRPCAPASMEREKGTPC
ncbi:PAS domain S-box protein [Cystobacter fuscus]